MTGYALEGDMPQHPKFPGSLAAQMRRVKGTCTCKGRLCGSPVCNCELSFWLDCRIWDEVGADKVHRLIDAQSQEVDERLDEGKGGV